MAVYVEQVHMEGGTGHEHIAKVKWQNRTDKKTGESTKAEMVKYIDVDKGEARVADGSSYVQIGTVQATPKYIRTHADGKWTDNLLALPRY
jgi:hypothetical protein